MNVPENVRRYARNAHKRYADERGKMRERINERPGDFTADRFVEYQAARALYNLYAEPLTLDADGNSAHTDEELMDRIHDARATALRSLRTNQLTMSGIEVVMQQVGMNAVSKFLSETEFVELMDEEPEELSGRALLNTLRAADSYKIVTREAEGGTSRRAADRIMSASNVFHLFSVALDADEGRTVTGTADRIECGELIAIRETTTEGEQ